MSIAQVDLLSFVYVPIAIESGLTIFVYFTALATIATVVAINFSIFVILLCILVMIGIIFSNVTITIIGTCVDSSRSNIIVKVMVMGILFPKLTVIIVGSVAGLPGFIITNYTIIGII